MTIELILQESTGEVKMIPGLLRDQMEEDGRGSRTITTRMTINQRLGLRAFGYCGATWGSSFRSTAISVREDNQPPQHQHKEQQNGGQSPSQLQSDQTEEYEFSGGGKAAWGEHDRDRDSSG
ncbi:conserved hypothetical protein [Ricinus communis]|uniref:Uncharacterized protein n=1 Tax=Ricinus communis TaxID=3988 RepID=B9T635_RICCO|nr:conserved hypothetical protein [Ricinus communis]